MEYNNLLVEDKEGVRIVTLNRPQELNSLNSELLSELDFAMADAAGDSQIKVIIITGAGKAFAAGADIGQMAGMNAVEGKSFGAFGSDVFRRIETLNKPVIAAVNGYALGGGCELAMACDIRIGSSKAKVGQPETNLGITPGFSGTQRLARIVGIGRAKEMIYTGDPITAEEAYRIGLFNKVTEPDQLLDTALQMAGKIAAKAPLAVQYAKEAVNQGTETDIDTGIALEANLFGMCFSTQDQKEGMKAFLERRPPVFKGE
ncbi:MAG: short-chain-enoyl-CoA hydratase [Bacteroides sp.]|nr:short-chain-enoyl-CoA hydratase [Bacteroides sp.]MCM1086336.1 short-chain-enoyl-CoA hydratase [Bacteroides sp.]MCM1168949.1 short-chain-enoyl-CoA hydratase [Bacteroides sp.]